MVVLDYSHFKYFKVEFQALRAEITLRSSPFFRRGGFSKLHKINDLTNKQSLMK